MPLLLSPVRGEQRLELATPNDPPDGEAGYFTLAVDGTRCLVAKRGIGVCRGGGAVWRFKLPVSAGGIESLYALKKNELILAYSVSDSESEWATIVGLEPGSKRPIWVHGIRGLNMDAPAIVDNVVLVGAANTLVAVSIADGALMWRHEWLYDGSGRTFPKLRPHPDRAELQLTGPSGDAESESHCFLLATGAPSACP